MSGYLLRRLGATVISLFSAALIAFLASRFTPGDPIRLMVGDQNVAPEVVRRLQRQYGLDQPLALQYLYFVRNALGGDFGTSYYYVGKPVLQVIAPGLTVTLKWQTLALALAVVGALVMGLMSATRHNSWLDHGIMLFALAGISLPSFVLATILILIFSVRLGLLPVAGLISPAHYILPSLTMAAQPCALLTRLLRASMLEVIHQDYMMTARAKGLREAVVVVRHGLKNALLPTFTVLGIMVGRILAGAFLIETVFSIPGIGRIGVQAVVHRDYPVILAITVLLAAAFLVVTLVVDALYGLLDPRIRYA
ncbi:MAG: ABC transporter permease [Armatimonadota bacterium]|nr:ABC transporter permease [Armatimonadota bacterium]